MYMKYPLLFIFFFGNFNIENKEETKNQTHNFTLRFEWLSE